ncbi:MAG: LuxR C-terminal-related transcriptional regulator [Sulfuricurvum sp.]|nr:LuxR C-terminal-related transcriptional regulator [Sulfuricurvum sp.]
MKLSLVANDVNVRERWMSAFFTVKPTASSKFSLDIEYDTVIFISDTIVVALSEAERANLFLHSVMVFSMVPDFVAAQKFLAMGAMGYGNAMMHESHLHSAFQALEEGKVWLHPDFISLMISQIRHQNSGKEKSLMLLDGLSKREKEVALMLGQGDTHQKIADTLDITVRTVKAHATAIYQKLDVKDRLALSILLHS